MSMKLKDLQKNVHIVPVMWDGETCNVSYKPGAITGKTMKKVINQTEEGDVDPMYDFLGACVIDWDLIDEKGEPIIVDRELLEDLPLPYIRHVFQGIVEGSSTVGEAQSS